MGRRRLWTAARVILLLAVVALALGWLGKSPCLRTTPDSHGVQQLAWGDDREYTDLCYSDVLPLYSERKLDQPAAFPYRTSWEYGPHVHVRYMEYPVLTGLFQWAGARLAQGYAALAGLLGRLPVAAPVDVYFDVVAFFLGLSWLVVVWAVSRLAGPRRWDAALVAVSPLVTVHAFTNFDLLAVGCALGGLLAWARRRPILAGILLGLGGAAKLYPLFLLGPLLVLCWRAGKLRAGWSAVASAAITWVVVNAPIYLLYPVGWGEFFRLNTGRGADRDSLYYVLSYFTGWAGFDGALPDGQAPTILNTVSAALFLLCCAGIAWVAMSAPTRPRVAQLCLLVVAAFLVTDKVWSPQYSLWLVPLAVLAIPRWKPLLAWMIVDALVWVPRMLSYLSPEKNGLPLWPFLDLVFVRDLAVLGLCALVLREVYRPELDLVRRGGDDDPGGGFLDAAEDRLVLGRRSRAAGDGQGLRVRGRPG